jgi:hypothetical protein
MPRVGLEPMIPMFERATVHALDRVSTVNGKDNHIGPANYMSLEIGA